MENCIFCKIVSGDIPSSKIYEDEKVIAFNDIDPQAPTHVLIVPKEHVKNVMEVKDETLLSYMTHVASKLACALGIGESGFRLVINTGADGGQTVEHLHMHMLGGRGLAWPPG